MASNPKSKLLLSPSISKVLGIAILRNDGSRIYSKYYTEHFNEALCVTKEGNLKEHAGQIAFEKSFFEKSQNFNFKAMKPSDTDVFGFGRFTILFKVLSDVLIYIIADSEENEALLADALSCITSSMYFLVKQGGDIINNNFIKENFQGVILIIDEVIDSGIIICTDSDVIQVRATMLGCDYPLPGDLAPNSATASSTSQSSSQSSGSAVGFLKSFFNR